MHSDLSMAETKSWWWIVLLNLYPNVKMWVCTFWPLLMRVRSYESCDRILWICDTLLIKDKGLISFSFHSYCIRRKKLSSCRRIMHDATNNESNVFMIFFCACNTSNWQHYYCHPKKDLMTYSSTFDIDDYCVPVGTWAFLNGIKIALYLPCI